MVGLLALVRIVFGLSYFGLHGYIAHQVYLADGGFWKVFFTFAMLIFADMYWCYQWGAVALGAVILIIGTVSFLSGLVLESATQE